MRNTKIQNTAELHSQNKKKILYALRKEGKLTKRDISSHTALSFAAVSGLTNQMIEDQLIHPCEMAKSSGGRHPVLLTLHEDHCFFLALNFSISGELRLALMTLSGHRAFDCTVSVPPCKNYEDLLQDMAKEYNALLHTAGITPEQILGAVAAVPGLCNSSTGVILNSTIPLFEGKPLSSDLRRILNMDVTIENDANLLALACYSNENIRSNAGNLLFLYIGEGLGVGFTTEHQLFTGAHGCGGEISHMPLGRAGYPCYCGQTNCVETELSIGGFIRKYNDRTIYTQISTDAQLTDQWTTFLRHVEAQETTALGIVEDNGRLLGTLISTLIHLLDPEEIVIGGYIEELGDQMLPIIQHEIRRRAIVPDLLPTPLRFVKGYNRLILAGCGELAFSNWNP